jgi:transcription antitermination factor NusG
MTDHWFLAQVQVQRELSIARELSALQLDYFLPITQVKIVRHYEGRKHVTYENRVLFPGWLFINGDESRDRVYRSKYRFGIVPMNAKYEPVLRRELKAFEVALSVNPRLGMEPYKFRKAQDVRIIDGPYAGIDGRTDGNFRYDSEVAGDETRVWLSADVMGQKGIPLKIERRYIEPLD